MFSPKVRHARGRFRERYQFVVVRRSHSTTAGHKEGGAGAHPSSFIVASRFFSFVAGDGASE